MFVALPTGEDKSLIYATLLLVFKDLRRQLSLGTDSSIHCIVVVASPLMLLMHDQVSAFSEKGLSCTLLVINSLIHLVWSVGNFRLLTFLQKLFFRI